jgi:hypothetical protein
VGGVGRCRVIVAVAAFVRGYPCIVTVIIDTRCVNLAVLCCAVLLLLLD